MKKIFTLMLTVSLASATFAQFSASRGEHGSNNDIAYNGRGDRRDDDRFDKRHYFFKKKEMDKQVAEINRMYDKKICDVRDNWFMRAYKKQRIIRKLEEDRKCDIDAVYAKFRYRNDRFEDDGPRRK